MDSPSSRYAYFLNACLSGIAEDAPGAEVLASKTELDVQSLWFAGAFGTEFTSSDGKVVKVRDFGVWNHAEGPDFVDCSVLLDGVVQRGSIELDPDVRDWERHGHSQRAHYEGVILHLYLKGPEARVFTRTAQHREVTQVQLRDDMLQGSAAPRRMAEARLGRCAEPFQLMDEARVRDLLEAAAQYRLQRKSAGWQALIRAQGRDQAVFQGLAAALGYRPNQRAFTILAQRLPLKQLLKLSAPKREAFLFGASGFLESVRYEDTLPETRAYLRMLWEEWWKVRQQYVHWLTTPQQCPWVLSGIRPGNHPQRRLGALVALLQKWKAIMAFLNDAEKWDRKGFVSTLLSAEHDYWTHHYTLLAAPSAKPVALIGETRAQEILANLCYPLLLPERPGLWDQYLQLPAGLENQKVRRAALRLFGQSERAARFQKTLAHQQGLIQVYEDYCLEDDSACADCPFPERLKDWPIKV